MATLTAQGLKKSYKKRNVVTDVNIEVQSGKVVGLLGPNGAGKTTTFYMITGLIPLDGGSIHLDALDISNMPIHQRAQAGIGYLPQEASVFRKLSVKDNLMAILELRKDLNASQRLDKYHQLVEDLQIGHITQLKGQSLSGGERRRVEIARALALDPQFILLDEPFAGVDPISVKDIQLIIEHLTQKDIGVLITDHNVRETLGVCHQAYILYDGKILVSGSPEEVLNNADVRRVYLGDNFK